ncbi:MAG: sensor histidine kinase, partial [Anaerolineae bacterium]|nr:sensor histidine kinase [Anaerolineae bacterium]
DYLRELRGTAQEALQEMRLLLFELRPPVLEEEGLVAALQTRLEAVERRSGLEIALNIEGNEDQLPLHVEEALYRIALEALNNALKHAQAHKVEVLLHQSPNCVKLEIVDDGLGFDPANLRQKGGMGLRGMQERARLAGGQLTVDSRPDEGTKVLVEIAMKTHQEVKHV